MDKETISNGLLWKLFERFSVYGCQFIIQLILARLLSPDNYGALALMMIFINLANGIIQNGFNTALIQDKNVTEVDFSSVFWLMLGISTILYIVLFISAPYFSVSYDMPYLVYPFKVICLMLIPGALNSVQLAIIRRSMNFKKEFMSNLTSIVSSGLIGITLAYFGYGLWALVIQVLLNTTISCITMWQLIGWRPSLVFDKQRVRVLFSYGYKLVFAGLLDTLSNNLAGLIIGFKYTQASLGYYTRGNQFPNALMSGLNSAVQSVMFSALSQLQDDRIKAKQLMRKAMTLSAFCVFLLMALLAGIARPMVQLLLTDKWISCVPYIQIFCFSYAFWPVHTSNLQAINAMGRSDIFLRLEIYKKIIGWSTLAFAVFYFDDPIAIATTSVVITIISCFINCYPNKYLLDYSYIEQMKDILPYFVISVFTFYFVLILDDIVMNDYAKLFMEIIFGSIFYLIISHILKLEAYIEVKKKINSITRGALNE